MRAFVSIGITFQEEGLNNSLYHKAGGSVTIATESHTNNNDFFTAALRRNSESISTESRVLADLLRCSNPDLLRPAAIQKVLPLDAVFVDAVSKKSHYSALFVLNLNPEEEEIRANIPWMESRRPFVLPEDIIKVFISNQHRHPSYPLPKAKYIPSYPADILFSYRDGTGSSYSFPLKQVLIPDYYTALKNYIDSQSPLEYPLFTHMTRLPLYEED